LVLTISKTSVEEYMSYLTHESKNVQNLTHLSQI